MQLSAQQMTPLALGYQNWLLHEGAWRPERMPKQMQPLYEVTNDARKRMLCTSGVRLRFDSDTTRLAIKLAYGIAVRAHFKFDLFVDGNRVKEVGFGPDNGDTVWEGVIFENTQKQKRTFDLWLPHVAQADVISMEVDDNSLVQPAAPLPVNWLIYGGSITQGMVSTLPTRHAYAIAALQHDAQIFNLAVGGAKCELSLASLVPEGNFDLVSIAYGTNDFIVGVSLQEYHDNTRALVEKCLRKFPEAVVLVITPTPWVGRTEPNKNGQYLSDYRTALAPLAQLNKRVKVIDGMALVPDEEGMFVDMVHPNDEGFLHYGRVLGEHVKNALLQK